MASAVIRLLNNLLKSDGLRFCEGNTVIVVGAGVSIPSGLPSGFSILSDLLHWLGLKLLLEFYVQLGEGVIKPIFGLIPDFIRYPRLEVLFFAMKSFLRNLEIIRFIERFWNLCFFKVSLIISIILWQIL